MEETCGNQWGFQEGDSFKATRLQTLHQSSPGAPRARNRTKAFNKLQRTVVTILPILEEDIQDIHKGTGQPVTDMGFRLRSTCSKALRASK